MNRNSSNTLPLFTLRHAKAGLNMLIRRFPKYNTTSASKILMKNGVPSIKLKSYGIGPREICKILLTSRA